MHPKNIAIADYTYELPDERIAKYPLSKRDESKLLFYKNGEINERIFRQLPEIMSPDTLLVYNNTKVIRARMYFYKSTGAKIEIFCLEPEQPADYALNFQQTESVIWRCLVGGAKKWKEEKLSLELENGLSIFAEKVAQEGADFLIRFSWENADYTFSDVLEASGNIPIPPYLNRKSEASDDETYQTVYAKYKGSVAAPTAGLHFTDEVLGKLRNNGVTTDEVTLHVGAGTFQPVKADKMQNHAMHTETILVHLETLKNLRDKLGNIIAVGTTSVRTLESIFWIGNKLMNGEITDEQNIHIDQWVAYDSERVYQPKDVFTFLVKWMEERQIDELHANTQIIIAPGYKFKVIAGMLTNFHQPNSTLLLLVSALVGEDWRKIYDYALRNDFRFLSYGDSSLLMKDC